jgi:hypothetical protein
MQRNSSAWLWLLLLMYALYAAFWSEKLFESALHPTGAWFGFRLPLIIPTLQALLG